MRQVDETGLDPWPEDGDAAAGFRWFEQVKAKRIECAGCGAVFFDAAVWRGHTCPEVK